MHLILTYSL